MRHLLFTGVIFCLFCSSAFSAPPSAEQFLLDGRTKEGEKALSEHLKQNPRDDQARFGLGVLQFFAAVEHLGQNLYNHGLKDPTQGFGSLVPIARLPVPQNPEPKTVTYEAVRGILQNWIDDLAKAESTLAAIQDKNVKLSLRVGKVKLDFTGKAQTTEISQILESMRMLPRNQASDFLIGFDRADASWLRGYCHLLSALTEFALAHDGKELFDATAHLFFAKVKSPFEFLQSGRKVFEFGGNYDIADLIAFIHLIRLPVKEPERMKAALNHLETMLKLSKEMWKLVQEEKDDDNEWIPNPAQRGVLNIPIRRDMIEGWLGFVEEAESLLQGKRLIPFWRGNETRAINLRRVFTEPRTFDLVLWIQGTGAAPYLEKGELTRAETWERFMRVFQGEFIGFVIWFN